MQEQDDTFVEKLNEEMEKNKEEEQNKFNSGKDAIIDMIAYYTTTCDASIDEAQRQAFLSIAREKQKSI